MFQIVPNPNWVARPGDYAYSHEAARSVDVTLALAAGGTCAPSDAADADRKATACSTWAPASTTSPTAPTRTRRRV